MYDIGVRVPTAVDVDDRRHRDVRLAVEGLLAGMKPGSVVVDSSTADPVSTAIVAAELKDAGIDFAFPSRTVYAAGDDKRPLSILLSGGGDRNAPVLEK